MIRESISGLALTTAAANALFKDKIYGDNFLRDESMLATLRAIVAPKLKEGQSLHHIVKQIHVDDRSKSMSEADAVRTLTEQCNPIGENQFVVYNVQGKQENADAFVETIRAAYQKNADVEEVGVVYNWYKKHECTVCAFNNEAKNLAFVVVSMMEQTRYHMLQPTLRHLFPWFLGAEPFQKGSFEGNLILSIIDEENGEKFTELIAENAEQYDFRSPLIREKLHGFEAKHAKQVLAQAERELESMKRNRDDYLSRAVSESRRIEETQAKIFGAKYQIEQTPEDELMDYFLMNQHLTLINVGDNYVEFMYEGGYMDMWDEDKCEVAIKNHTSELYSGCGNKNDAEMFYRAVFIDQTLKLKMCGAYRLSLDGRSYPLRKSEFDDYPVSCKHQMRNPHGYNHACFGSHETVVNKCVMDGNYVMAAEQCCAAARNLNFTDGVVVKEFSKDLWKSDANRYVLMPDGRSMTAKQAVEWLKSQKGA